MGDFLALSYNAILMLSKIRQVALNVSFKSKDIKEIIGNKLSFEEAESAFNELLNTNLITHIGRKYNKKKQVEYDEFSLTERGKGFGAYI